MNRLFSLSTLVLVALASSARAQDLAKRVSFFAPAAPASRVLAGLSREAGVELRTSQATAGEALLIKVHDVSISELMDHIAKAVDAEWQKEGSGFTLVRSASIEQRERDAEIATRDVRLKAAIAKAAPVDRGSPDEKSLRKYIDAVVTKTEKAFRESQQKAQPTEVYGDTTLNNPAGRAVWGMLSLIDTKTLASIQPAQRVVFSTSPNPVQHPFTGSTERVLGRFLNEQRLFARVLKEAEEESGAEDKEALFHMDGLGSGVMGPGNPNLGIGRALLIVTGVIGDSLQFKLVVTDPKGQRLGGGDCTITLAKEPVGVAAADATSIHFSPETTDLAKLIGKQFRSYLASSYLPSKNDAGQPTNVHITVVPDGGGRPRPSGAMREIILNPDKRDPMSLAPTEGLVAVAEAHQENIVARLPDSAFGPMMEQVPNKLNVGTFLLHCAGDWGIDVHEGQGWLVASPREPLKSDRNTFDRAALSQLLKRVDALGYLSLDDAASYAVVQGERTLGDQCALRYLQILNPTAMFQVIGLGEWDMVRLYGLLSQSQRTTLTKGGDIPLQNLSQEQALILAHLTYDSYEGPVAGVPEDPANLEPFGFLYRTPGQERTDLLPNGAITNGYLHIGRRTSPAAYEENSATGASHFLSVQDAADSRLLAETDDPFVSRIVPHKPNFDQYREASLDDFDFTFLFAKDLSITRVVQGASILEGSQRGPYESLSESFQKSVADKLVNLRQALKNYTSQMRSNKTPPPLWTLGSTRKG